jgi:hypothetical protein
LQKGVDERGNRRGRLSTGWTIRSDLCTLYIFGRLLVFVFCIVLGVITLIIISLLDHARCVRDARF